MILLTSNIPPVIDDLFERFLKGSGFKTMVFIETAAELGGDDKQWLEDDYNSWISIGLDVVRYSITGKDKSAIEAELQQYDIIYVSGGNTFYLLQQMQKTGALGVIRKLVKEGKAYIGTSAGSVVAGPDISAVKNLDNEKVATELQGYEGLALTDVVVLPHWGSPYFKELYLNQRLDHLYDNPVHKVVLLTDNQYLLCKEDGSVQIFREVLQKP